MSELATEGLYPRTKRASPSIRRLALSILIQAMRDVMAICKHTSGHCGRGERNFWRRDALLWFSEDSDYPGGLLWVCDVLERDPEGVRAWVEEYQAAKPDERRRLRCRVGQLRKGGL